MFSVNYLWEETRNLTFRCKKRMPHPNLRIPIMSDVLNWSDESYMFGIVEPVRVARSLGQILWRRMCVHLNSWRFVSLCQPTRQWRGRYECTFCKKKNDIPTKCRVCVRLSVANILPDPGYRYIGLSLVRFKPPSHWWTEKCRTCQFPFKLS